MADKKLYKFRLEELNGEQEYTYDHLLYAESQEVAQRMAHEYARTFYEDDGPDWTEVNDGSLVYFFIGGAIAVEVGFVSITTKEEWQEWMFNRSLLNEP